MKEIEKKWFIKPDINYQDIIKGLKYDEIKDFYFNDYTRLRIKNNAYSITIKSNGTEIRDEFTFSIDKNELDFLPVPTLDKKRYYYHYNDLIFEINVFSEIFENYNDMKHLVIVECEFNSIINNIDLPSWVGVEVTGLKQFYGYNLYKLLKKVE